MSRERGAPVTIVRPGWIYGPGDSASFARIAGMVETGQMMMVGSGENHLPLIYARDAAQGVVLASEAARAEGRSYLLVNDEPVTQRDFLTAIAAELGVPIPSRRIPYQPAVMLGAAVELVGRLTRRAQPPRIARSPCGRRALFPTATSSPGGCAARACGLGAERIRHPRRQVHRDTPVRDAAFQVRGGIDQHAESRQFHAHCARQEAR